MVCLRARYLFMELLLKFRVLEKLQRILKSLVRVGAYRN